LTGIMLGLVLLVMVGEQAQEMQLAHWIPTTSIQPLANVIPAWMGVWFSVFPTVETMLAQLIAAALVLGFYFAPRLRKREPVRTAELPASKIPERPVNEVEVAVLEPVQSGK
jgi:high-affinity iron transporter